jgi:hypothetical protein
MTNLKKCDAGERVFKTFLYMAKNKVSVQEIVNYFANSDIDGKNYTNEAILKYINTLKLFGIQIVRDKDKYQVLAFPPYISLSENEIEGLRLISQMTFPDSGTKEIIDNFVLNLEKRLADSSRIRFHEIKNYDKKNPYFEQYKDIIEKLELNLKRNSILKIITDKDEFIAKPIDMYVLNSKIYYTVYISKKAKKYDIEITKIKEIYPLPSYNNEFNYSESNIDIIFRLKGRLAKSYTLKEGEYIKDKCSDGSILISSTCESENILLRRLLRYENLCEVEYPNSTRLKMKELIKNISNLYSE